MKYLTTLLIAAAFFLSCSRSVEYRTIDGFAQGTTYSITYGDSLNRDLRGGVDSILAAFDKSLSNFDSLSILSRSNRGEDPTTDQWFDECFATSQIVYQNSDSLFDPTLHPLITAYGFGSRGKEGYQLPSQQQIDSIKVFVGLHKVNIANSHITKQDPRIALDFSAIAQGYSVDVVASWLESLGITNYVVEIGGEVFARGKNAKGNPWRIGIDKPTEGNIVPGQELQTVLELDSRGLATSGNYRKFFTDSSGTKITHEIDPRTGHPSSDSLLSVTLTAPNAALADGYATACMVGGLEWTRRFLSRNSNIGAFLVYSSADSMRSETINLQ